MKAHGRSEMERPDRHVAASVFGPPFDRLSPEALLEHFRTRTGVHYEPVPSAEETRRDRIDAILENRFDLIGETHILSDPPCWIANPSADREWHFALHKFYFAVGLGMVYRESGDRRYLDKWISLTSSWIDRTPPLFVNSQVTGRRIQNWIYAYHYFVANGAEGDVPAEFHQRFLVSLWRQVDGLRETLDASRNHRTLELYGIFLASVVFPEMNRAPAWREFALAEILENMRADLLPDGVQCELSTHYHHTVLKNYVNIRRLARANDIQVPAEMDTWIRKALDFALHIHKPDGLIPSLGDGDIGGYLDLLRHGHELYGDPGLLYGATLGREGKAPCERAKAFPDAGYYILRSGWGDRGERYEDERYLVFDCGPLGEGNHGHLDVLNIEVAAFGESLIVDPGRYTYRETGGVNWRVLFRGTSYHNTVVVDGRNQTRYEAGRKKFKIQGPAPDHELRAFIDAPGLGYLHGIARSHEYEVVHERKIFFIESEYWIVWDILHGQDEHGYDQLFHLLRRASGKVTLERARGTLSLRSPKLVLARSDAPEVSVAVEDSFVSRVYGEKKPAPVVRFSQRARVATFHTVLFPHKEGAPALSVREIPVREEDGTPAAAGTHAISVTVEREGTRFTDLCLIAARGGRWRSFAGYRFDGTYLALRLAADGALVHLRANQGASLESRRTGPVTEGRPT